MIQLSPRMEEQDLALAAGEPRKGVGDYGTLSCSIHALINIVGFRTYWIDTASRIGPQAPTFPPPPRANKVRSYSEQPGAGIRPLNLETVPYSEGSDKHLRCHLIALSCPEASPSKLLDCDPVAIEDLAKSRWLGQRRRDYVSVGREFPDSPLGARSTQYVAST